MDKKGLAIILGAPDKGAKGDDDDGSDKMKLGAMRDFIGAVKGDDAEDALKAYQRLCDLHPPDESDSKDMDDDASDDDGDADHY